MPDPLVSFKSIRYGQLRYFVRLEQRGTFKTRFGPIELDTVVANNIAEKMMDAAIRQLDKTRVRFRTGRLEEALKDPRAHYVKRNEIGMFVASFLDEEVPYWRAIDKGSSKALGRVISGVFQDSPLEYDVPGVGQATPFRGEARGVPGGLGQSLHRSGQTKTKRRTRDAATYGREILRAAGVPERQRKVTGRIEHPIKPHRFVQAARKAFRDADAKKLADGYIKTFAKNARRRARYAEKKAGG